MRALAEALPECPSSHDAAHDRAELDECRVVWRSLGPKAAPAIEQLLAELAPKAQDLDADSFLGPQQAAKRRLECAKLLLEVSQATANQVTLRVLNALIQLGDSDDCVVRGHTARTLAAMGPLAGPAIPMLVKMLVDEEPYWEGGDFYGNGGIQNLPADQAIDALGKIGKPAVPALKLALSDEDRRMRERAARALGRMGEPARDAVSDLTRALDDPSFVVRAVAAESLGNVQVDRDDVLNALADRLSDSHLRVRLAAIRALGQFGPRAERHLPRLEPLENSPFEDCQRAARDAIKRISS